MKIREFMRTHYRHFNAAACLGAAEAYDAHLAAGGMMLVTLAGAMSTGELGRSLAEMIRRGKVHAISCTGANLEEDVFNLVAHEHYVRVPNWRELSPSDEVALLDRHLNRVTDTCIPEEEAIRRIESFLLARWKAADKAGERKLPHQYFVESLLSGELEPNYQADPSNSWLLAAAEAGIPVIVPGWEDSTLGNIFAARVMDGTLSSSDPVRPGIDYMIRLSEWYVEHCGGKGIGFFQVGGGIAGDFPICAVPMMRQDLERDIPLWSYFCQISDSTTSYGSYSGAVPNEKITWEKLSADTPRFIVESDASIVAPLIFGYVLDW
ncbi:MAG: deoxyhypusine synthase family protein [Phycisphaeraceae bacterium]|nr:deoxyhypusine synthase family protein [Phycisphaeraceae bacterium]